jgi:hypothetical protein
LAILPVLSLAALLPSFFSSALLSKLFEEIVSPL